MKRFLLGLILALLASPALAQLPVCNNGDMIYRGSTGYQCVPYSNTAGPFLQSNGPSAAPTWSNQAASAFRLPTQTTNTFLGNSSGTTASPTPNTVSNILDTIGYDISRPPSPGAIIYKSAVAPNNAWQTLAPGVAGTTLTSGGTANPPFWTNSGQATLTTICTTVGAIVYYDTPSLSWKCLAPGTAGQLLSTGGVGANPSWTVPFTAGSVIFAGATGALSQDPAISWDNTLKKFNLNFSGTAMAPAETDTQFQMDGADGFATTIFMDSHGATAALDFRQQGGTKASPTATATGATMGQINFQGWDGTAYGKNARVRATAEPSGATWTLTDHGVGVGIFTTAPGTTSLSEKFHVFGNGGLATAGLASQGAGTLNLAALYSNSVLIVDSGGNVTAPTVTSAGAMTTGANGGTTGTIIAKGSTSGTVTVTAQAAAGTPAIVWPTTSGTLTTTGTSPIVVNATTGAISCPTCNVTGSNVASVSNSDGTLTISPTTGAVVASLALSHANTWLSTQTFPSPIMTGNPVLAAPSATTLIVGSSTTLPSPAVGVFTANATTLPNPPTGTILHVGGANSTSAVALVDAFAGNPTVVFRRADTSAAAKSAVQSGEVLLDFGAIGYGATAYSTANRVQIVGKAAENWTDGAQGTSLQFNVAANGGITNAVALFLDNSGGASVGTTTSDGIGSIRANTSVNATTSYRLATKIAWSATAPTISSGFCTSPSISNNNGTAAFTITIGTGCAASTGVLTMPTASVGWTCSFNNLTTPASNTPSQTASTTTSVSVTNYARTTGLASNWTASEVINVHCTAY